MANLNKVFLIGNLTKDPQLSYLPNNQTPVCEFGLAVNRSWTGPDGVKKEETMFVDLSSFGKTAELLAKYKKKGDPLFIEGRLKLDQWEHEGQKRSKMRVIIENFQFLNRGAPGGYGGGAAQGEGAPAAEYQGEDAPPRPAPRQQYNRPPAARPAPQSRPAPAAAPNYEAGDAPAAPEYDAPPQIKDDDIPF